MVIMKIVFVLTALAGCLVLSITLNEVREGKISGIGRDNDVSFSKFLPWTKYSVVLFL